MSLSPTDRTPSPPGRGGGSGGGGGTSFDLWVQEAPGLHTIYILFEEAAF